MHFCFTYNISDYSHQAHLFYIEVLGTCVFLKDQAFQAHQNS